MSGLITLLFQTFYEASDSLGRCLHLIIFLLLFEMFFFVQYSRLLDRGLRRLQITRLKLLH